MKVLIIGGSRACWCSAAAEAAVYSFFCARKPAPRPRRPRSSRLVFVDLPEVLVNLSNAGTERAQYLKVKIVLEVAEQKMVAQIQPIMPR